MLIPKTFQMNQMNKDTLETIYSHTLRNRKELEASCNCGCAGCRTIFPAAETVDWVDEGQTGICPYCGTDALVGDAAGWQLTTELLEELNDLYF